MSDNFEQFPEIGPIDTPKQFHQLGIFVLDGSGSMGGQAQGGVTKADAVNIAVRDLLTRFKVSRVKQNFSFSVVTFDTSAQLRTPITEASSIDDNDDYNPMNGHGGGTNIFEGLKIAEQQANYFLNQADADGVPHSVIILVMTDGACFNPGLTVQTSENIKNGPSGGKVTICSTFFGQVGNSDEGAKNLLRDLATDRVMGFKEVYDADTLRTFFEKSISSASGVTI